MQNKPEPTEGQNSAKLEAESALRGAACCASSFCVECVADFRDRGAKRIQSILHLNGKILNGTHAAVHGIPVAQVFDLGGNPVQRYGDLFASLVVNPS